MATKAPIAFDDAFCAQLRELYCGGAMCGASAAILYPTARSKILSISRVLLRRSD